MTTCFGARGPLLKAEFVLPGSLSHSTGNTKFHHGWELLHKETPSGRSTNAEFTAKSRDRLLVLVELGGPWKTRATSHAQTRRATVADAMVLCNVPPLGRCTTSLLVRRSALPPDSPSAGLPKISLFVFPLSLSVSVGCGGRWGSHRTTPGSPNAPFRWSTALKRPEFHKEIQERTKKG